MSHNGDQAHIDRRSFLTASAALAPLLIPAALARTTTASASSAASAASARTSRARATPVPPVRGQVILPSSPLYAQAAAGYNERYDSLHPAMVVRPRDSRDVQTAVRWAADRGMALRARSGGHSYAGYSTLAGGMVLDLRELRGITVDTRAGLAYVGAGAQLIDVYAALAAHGCTIPAGSCPSVGVAGHVLGGGFGLASRRFGLATDSLVSARVVTADGRELNVSERAHPDLHWALRGGGGGNFGVVTGFTFRVHPVPASVSTFYVTWPWSQAADAIEAWQSWGPHATRDITSVLHLDSGGESPTVNLSGQYFGPAGKLSRLLAPILLPGASLSTGQRDYLDAQLYWAGCDDSSLRSCHTVGTRPGGTLPRASFQAKSTYVGRPLPAAGRAVLTEAVERAAPGAAILCDGYGGAVADLAPGATAFVHRDALFCVQYLIYPAGEPWLQSVTSQMRPYVTGGAYVNYIDPTLQHWQAAYYGTNYPRLTRIRREIDPHHFFDFPQAIGR